MEIYSQYKISEECWDYHKERVKDLPSKVNENFEDIQMHLELQKNELEDLPVALLIGLTSVENWSRIGNSTEEDGTETVIILFKVI